MTSRVPQGSVAGDGPQEVRPKVFVDPDGAEWRCVDGQLQARIEDDDAAAGVLERKFGRGSMQSNAGWLEYLENSGTFLRSLPAARRAIANPMTSEEGEADDDLLDAHYRGPVRASLVETPAQAPTTPMCIEHFSPQRGTDSPPICKKAYAKGLYPCEFAAPAPPSASVGSSGGGQGGEATAPALEDDNARLARLVRQWLVWEGGPTFGTRDRRALETLARALEAGEGDAWAELGDVSGILVEHFGETTHTSVSDHLRAELSTARAALADARDHFALSEKRAQTFYDKWRTARGEGLALTEELLAARAALEERTRDETALREIRAITEPLALMLSMGGPIDRAPFLAEVQRVNRIIGAARGGSGVETPPNNTEHQSNDRQD